MHVFVCVCVCVCVCVHEREKEQRWREVEEKRERGRETQRHREGEKYGRLGLGERVQTTGPGRPWGSCDLGAPLACLCSGPLPVRGPGTHPQPAAGIRHIRKHSGGAGTRRVCWGPPPRRLLTLFPPARVLWAGAAGDCCVFRSRHHSGRSAKWLLLS